MVRNKFFGKTTVILTLISAFMFFFVGIVSMPKDANAAVSFGEELAYNGDLEGYFEGSTSNVYNVVCGSYEDRQYDCYCSSPNSGGQFVKDENNQTYVRLYYDGVNTTDSVGFWLQPGSLSAGTYTISLDIEVKGLSTGDYLMVSYNGDQSDALSKKLFNLADYNALPDGSEEGRKTISISFTISESYEFPATFVWFYHKFSDALECRIYSVSYLKQGSTENSYYNDFSAPFTTQSGDRIELGDGSLGFSDGVNAEISSESGNKAIKLSGGSASFKINLPLTEVGKYRIVFDIKISENYKGVVKCYFPPLHLDSYDFNELIVANNKSDFDFLDDAETEGYLNFSGTAMVDNFTLVQGLKTLNFTWTGGSASDCVYFDNFSVRLIEGSVKKRETPSTEGLTYRALVKGGNFEYLDENYVFEEEPTDETYYWGSNGLDGPAKVVSLDGNKVLSIKYDILIPNTASTKYASAFVFLDTSEFNTDDVYTLSYKFKYSNPTPFDPELGYQVTFIGQTGVEQYVQYLGYTDILKETAGVNTNEYSYTYEEADGWINVSLTFRMDSAFVSSVDSIRFLNFHNRNDNIELYIDDVNFGIWESKSSESGEESIGKNGSEKDTSSAEIDIVDAKSPSCSSSIYYFSFNGIMIIALAVMFIMRRLRRNK